MSHSHAWVLCLQVLRLIKWHKINLLKVHVCYIGERESKSSKVYSSTKKEYQEVAGIVDIVAGLYK